MLLPFVVVGDVETECAVGKDVVVAVVVDNEKNTVIFINRTTHQNI